MAAFFHRIGSLDLFQGFEKILAYLKTDQNDPKCPDLSVRPLRQHFFLGIGSLVFSVKTEGAKSIEKILLGGK